MRQIRETGAPARRRESRGPRRQVRLLVVCSSPNNRDTVTIPPLLANICGESREAGESGRTAPMDAVRLDNPTKRELQEALKEGWDIVHFCGHGEFDAGGGGSVVLCKEKGTRRVAEPVTDVSFAELLGDPAPELVFLQACYGAPNAFHAFRGLALTLACKGVGAVIAMQYSIENEVANKFAPAFYESLAQGLSIEECVQAGREMLGTEGRE